MVINSKIETDADSYKVRKGIKNLGAYYWDILSKIDKSWIAAKF